MIGMGFLNFVFFFPHQTEHDQLKRTASSGRLQKVQGPFRREKGGTWWSFPVLMTGAGYIIRLDDVGVFFSPVP